ncbi:murein DD-endopeptidase MepM/ murein hydrolase activator NlpD [Sphingomonas vulcanisoli]|uniref:Murein DD-endopeptidase MepM/ murein hydrolase activator NlpD n=1 Tax=Sphingomonas vulcanisoli TaxID=1658060 RepID=A0ABX0TQX3_9SPHN|nr:M23 family metallopeptidase [Sphingomonas vulcanisoli]NIJ07124.1 murein DD-endopeptidase MepM/ murein hydrolase activator NlpD [Sphingomonas vulcanisoli]
MSRLGCLLLAVFAIIIGGFFALVRYERAAPAAQPSAAAQQSAPSPLPPAAATPAGGLVIPVSGVQPAQLTDTWGDARGDGTRAHHAIDIMAPRGTPVVAAAAGTVEKIFESKDGGHTVYVRRSDPAWVDYYAHLDSYAPNLAEGMKIGQGQLIGAVGSSGDASPEAPHLHYEIKQMAPGERWWQGTNINPYAIFSPPR